ncbi:MAG TPA: 30S ribosomal protein S12 methylthiotransferase RimO [Bdellovibrionales bacterium]|nr:30S ribosomal protein S12 methylthiotransferase RimO [Bdellovibrionales bacterium]
MNEQNSNPIISTNQAIATSQSATGKKVHFVSLGCPKNLVDSEIMLGHLLKEGYSVTDAADDADTVVVNTCGFIDEAKKESLAKIMEMSELKENGRLKQLVVAGCLTQRYKDDLVEGLPEADLFVGSGEFQNIAKILKNHEAGEKNKRFFNLPTYLQEEETPRVNSQPGYRAYLKISEGCLKRCAFCAIPKIRGNLQSRRLTAVVNEAKLLVAGGVRELNIISHDFTDYGFDLRRKNLDPGANPAALLNELSLIEGLDWVRVLYLYPDGITDEVIELIKTRPRLVKYFDMPLQHINNRVLKSMNRQMTREEIMDRLTKIRAEIPEAVIRTQFIVGFPGETEEDFQELLAFVKEQRFDRVGCFMYSPEDNTAGGKMDNQIDEETKQRRHDELMAIQMEISRDKHRAFIGKTIPVLVEGVSEETELLLQGRMSQQAPDIDGVVLINDGEAEIGTIVNVRITDSMDYDLIGEIVH